MRATSGEGFLSGERVERRRAAILAADMRGSAFNAWASPAGYHPLLPFIRRTSDLALG